MSLDEIGTLIEEMNPYIRDRKWGDLEAEYSDAAKKRAGAALAKRISEVDLASYTADLTAGLKKALAAAKKAKAKAASSRVHAQRARPRG